MKNLLAILLLAILLMGCDNSVKHAKANSIRQATNRTNDKHNLAMADSKALAPVRLIVKEVLLWSLMVGGLVIITSSAGATSYFLLGYAVTFISHRRSHQQIALDVVTRQYPLLMYGNGRRVFNPNNGERLRLSDVSSAELPRIEAQTKVQLAGLITDNSKIING